MKYSSFVSRISVGISGQWH